MRLDRAEQPSTTTTATIDFTAGGPRFFQPKAALPYHALTIVDTLRLVSVAAMIVSGCNGASNNSTSSSSCPPGVPCDCTYVEGAYYNCGTDGAVPACPSVDNAGTACAPMGASCVNCPEGAGVECLCADAGPVGTPGAQWVCIGSGYPCKGP